jgi:RNase P subunit RPR2
MSQHCRHLWLAHDERIGMRTGSWFLVTHLKCARCGFRRRMTFVKASTSGGSDAVREFAYNTTRATV